MIVKRSQGLNTKDLEEHIGRLLPSQQAFIFAPEEISCIASGFGSGKTRAGSIKGIILSAIFPGNVGMVGRYHATDLEDSVIPVFMDALPHGWEKSYRHHNRGSATLTLRNGSQVMFRHIHDASAKGATKSNRIGANLGWFFIDQMEQCEEEHFNGMLGRIRLPRVPKKFAFGAINPAGHDWIYRKFFKTVRPFKQGEFFQEIRLAPNQLGIVVDADENRMSNGGFIEDDYFDRQIANSPPEWVARYVHSSFDDFSGKIFHEYSAGVEDADLASVHNIEPFAIPSHWQCRLGIDVGGDCPWGVIPHFIDDWGNLIVVPGYHEKTVVTRDVANWIKTNLPWNDNRRWLPPVIDPENKVVALELANDHDIHCISAQKAVTAGIMRAASYFHVNEKVKLPQWYADTQPPARYARFAAKGSPRIFVFNNAITWRKDVDSYIWDENKKGEPKKTATERHDCIDASRYVIFTCPPASELPVPSDPHYAVRQVDPLSARMREELDKAKLGKMMSGRNALAELDRDETERSDWSSVGRDYDQF